MPSLDLTGRDPVVAKLMKWFEHGHLPARLAAVAAPCADLAAEMVQQIPDGDQLVQGLRKLLEAKDCLVRAELERTGERVIPRAEPAFNVTTHDDAK